MDATENQANAGMGTEELKQRLYVLAEEAKNHGAASQVLLTLVAALMMGTEREMRDCIEEHFTPQFRATLKNQVVAQKRAHLHVVG